jgi:hypothetical protein
LLAGRRRARPSQLRACTQINPTTIISVAPDLGKQDVIVDGNTFEVKTLDRTFYIRCAPPAVAPRELPTEA